MKKRKWLSSIHIGRSGRPLKLVLSARHSRLRKSAMLFFTTLLSFFSPWHRWPYGPCFPICHRPKGTDKWPAKSNERQKIIPALCWPLFLGRVLYSIINNLPSRVLNPLSKRAEGEKSCHSCIQKFMTLITRRLGCSCSGLGMHAGSLCIYLIVSIYHTCRGLCALLVL